MRDEDKTVLTMANDYQGKVKDFAMVVPVPTEITREQIHVGDMKLVDHIDAYTAPRLAEYFDPNPCVDMNALRRRAIDVADVDFAWARHRLENAEPIRAPPREHGSRGGLRRHRGSSASRTCS